AGDGGGVADRGRGRVAELVTDLHADGLVDRVGVRVRPADGERAAGAADRAGRGAAVAPRDEGGVGGGAAVRVGGGGGGGRAAGGGAGRGAEVDAAGLQRGRAHRLAERAAG